VYLVQLLCVPLKRRFNFMPDTVTLPEPIADPVSFECVEVTGSRTLQVDSVDGHRSSASIASSMAGLFGLPPNNPYYFRDDRSARMLADDVPLGAQIPGTGSRLMVVPKTKLGAK